MDDGRIDLLPVCWISVFRQLQVERLLNGRMTLLQAKSVVYILRG
jgi:hypothetical protein